MKKLLVILALVTLFACAKKEEKKDDFLGTPEQEKVEEPSRIKVIAVESGFTGTHEILEVDGHQYLSNYHGGLVHLESCPCKTK
jgi:hypothetical protein